MDAPKGRFSSLETSPSQAAVGKGGGAVLRDTAYYIDDALHKELAGEHEKALNTYSAALGEDPLCIEVWTRQLWMLLYLEEPVESRLWADKALLSFPNDPDILSLKSLAMWRSGLSREARDLNDAALAKTRESHNVWLARAEMQIADDVKSAGACFTHACRAASDSGLVRLRGGDILLGYRKFAEAVPYFREATQRLPDSSWAWYGYGRAQRAVGREDVAKNAFECAYNLTSRDPRYKNVLKAKSDLMRGVVRWLFGEKKG